MDTNGHEGSNECWRIAGAYTWEEVEEDLYRFREGVALCEGADGPANDVEHRLAMERVLEARAKRGLLKLFGVDLLARGN